MSTIRLKSLPPITVGFDYARTLQGNTPGGVAGTGFTGTETLTATVSQGQGLPSLFSPTVTWSNAASCQFAMSISGAQSAGLDIDETYYGLVEATTGGTTYPLAAFFLPTLPAPTGQMAATYLVSLPYAARLLAQLSLSEAAFESIPDLLAASSDAVQSFCMRQFAQMDVVEDLEVSLYGEIRLSRIPVNQVYRVQGSPRVAMTVSNSSAVTAWVSAVATGDLAGGQTITGLTLNSQAAGTTSSTTITFASLADQQISTLATAINAVGGGWGTTVNSTYGALPISEIINFDVGMGAAQADQPFGAAEYLVYSEELSRYFPHPDAGERTGIYCVGRRSSYSDAVRWGPGGFEMFGGPGGSGERWPNRVKASYNGGFATIPYEVQLATVELCKVQLERLKTDLLLRGESADKYSYEINDAQILALPKHILTALCRHRVTNA